MNKLGLVEHGTPMLCTAVLMGNMSSLKLIKVGATPCLGKPLNSEKSTEQESNR